jgi:hypothetical protein
VSAVASTVAVADQVRRQWLRALGPIGRRLVRDRELRVAVVFSAVVFSALLGTLLVPLWLLVLGPLVWGVPHVAADIRYLLVRTGFAERRVLWVAGGVPLLALGAGADLVWGFVGAAVVALVARAPLLRRLAVAATLLGIGVAFAQLGTASDIVFGHVHNFGAVALWWVWRRRTGRLHRWPLLLLLFACTLLLSDVSSAMVGPRLGWHAAEDSAGRQLWRLAPGVEPTLGIKLVLLFCFMQSVHYAMWMQLIPDEDRSRATVTTFRATIAGLVHDLGRMGLLVLACLSMGIVAWACRDLMAAGRGYFRMARFYGHLEVMAATLLLLEGRNRTSG